MGELVYRLLHLHSELFVGVGRTADAQHGESRRKRVVHMEVEECRNQFPVCEVARGTEDDQRLVVCFFHFVVVIDYFCKQIYR